jgi:dihydropteroate synthase
MPIVYEDVVHESIGWLWERLGRLKAVGYKGQVIIDPGIGFGKLPEHNVEILKRLNEYRSLGHLYWWGFQGNPLLVLF